MSTCSSTTVFPEEVWLPSCRSARLRRKPNALIGPVFIVEPIRKDALAPRSMGAAGWRRWRLLLRPQLSSSVRPRAGGGTVAKTRIGCLIRACDGYVMGCLRLGTVSQVRRLSNGLVRERPYASWLHR